MTGARPLPPEVAQALAEDAGTEGGGGAANDSLGDGVLVLGAATALGARILGEGLRYLRR